MNLLCGHLEPWSEIWPTSGIAVNGLVYELPMQVHPITVSESSLLRSPTASQGEGGALGEETARARGNTVGIRDNALDIAKLNGLPVSRVADNLMPTPTTQDGKNTAGPSQFERNTKPLNVEAVIASQANWGRFEPAIRRWEEVLGRFAPAPTKPDGKEGAHRLSSSFTEWMMGLPGGWITDVGLSRNEELKACGNGVVPQQAEMALRMLLEGINTETKRGGGMVVLPTPTVMDQRDGKHFRSVAIRELADGNNRGLNLNNIVEAGLMDWEDGDKFDIVDGKAVKTNG
jgi:hypothetical protein